jgi:hypothetical protein
MRRCAHHGRSVELVAAARHERVCADGSISAGQPGTVAYSITQTELLE